MAWEWAFFTQHYWSWNPAHKAGQTDWRRYCAYHQSDRRTNEKNKNRIMFQTLLFGAAYPKKSIKGKRLLRSLPPDLYRSPLHFIYGSKLCKRIRVHWQKERRKGLWTAARARKKQGSYTVWSSCPAHSSSGGRYSNMPETGHPRISQRTSKVVVVMGLPCFIRCSVFAETPCLKINAYSVTPFCKRVS